MYFVPTIGYCRAKNYIFSFVNSTHVCMYIHMYVCIKNFIYTQQIVLTSATQHLRAYNSYYARRHHSTLSSYLIAANTLHPHTYKCCQSFLRCLPIPIHQLLRRAKSSAALSPSCATAAPSRAPGCWRRWRHKCKTMRVHYVVSIVYVCMYVCK